MSVEVVWSLRAQKDLAALHIEDRDRVISAVNEFAETRQGDIKKLQGAKGLWRLRSGRYRVLFTYEDKPLILLVLKVDDRKDVYK